MFAERRATHSPRTEFQKTLQINGQLHANKLENHVFKTDKGKDFLKIEESNNQGEFQRTTLKVVPGPEGFTEKRFQASTRRILKYPTFSEGRKGCWLPRSFRMPARHGVTTGCFCLWTQIQKSQTKYGQSESRGLVKELHVVSQWDLKKTPKHR